MSIDKKVVFNQGTAKELTVELSKPTEQVKDWFFAKNLAGSDPGKEGRAIRKELETEGITMRSILATVKETEKAKQVVMLSRQYGFPANSGYDEETNKRGYVKRYSLEWVPKSAIEPQDPQLEAIKSAVGSSGE